VFSEDGGQIPYASQDLGWITEQLDIQFTKTEPNKMDFYGSEYNFLRRKNI
jgi:hypothetical protein